MSLAAAWDFAARFSPRAAVRCQDESGKYGLTTTTSSPSPSTAWAVHLTDSDHRFRLLGFDFDAKAGRGEKAAPALDADQLRARAHRDAQTLAGILTELRIEHVVCASGPAGGRHVWVALRDQVPAQLVEDLARAAGRLLPSLDIAPLCNVVTGALRPPYSPHRAGGASTPIAGNVEVLCRPTVRRGDVEALLHRLVELAPPPAVPVAAGGRVLPIENAEDGHPRIPGTWRNLSQYGWQLAREQLPADGSVDTSARLFAILLSAARAHWSLSDVQAQLLDQPGLEHVRTVRGVDGARTPRPRRGAASPTQVLARNWAAAVEHLADNAQTDHKLTNDDPDFDARAGEMAAAIVHLDRKADACMGRWARPGGARDRLVLDALMELALTAMRLDVGASIRDLATKVGICHTGAWRALSALEADGWIRMVTYTAGTQATVWRVLPWGLTEHGDVATEEDHPSTAAVHSDAITGVTLGGTAPDSPHPLPHSPTAGAARRTALLRQLTARRELARHDCFTGRAGLGPWAALVYSRALRSPQTLRSLFPASTPADVLERASAALHEAGLFTIDARGRAARTAPEARTSYAEHVGAAGTLGERAEQYALESELWAWWVAESMWTTERGRQERRVELRHGASVRRRPGQQVLPVGQPSWADRRPYPRRPGGRRDHRAARSIIVAARREVGDESLHRPSVTRL
ncbi:winged helix-turn-helix domain-containing protein [Tsukamurella pulmonis]|uniref:winged helix-turn-helix domain-containing protein n=1 Tax=Tsukamurella pulmonis TaxID=47312 RepID=UPI001112A07A|nr:winged helix-turn-helix domain-containing protein [Tsukamurella pulmonis]